MVRVAANDDRATSARLDISDSDLSAYAAGTLSAARRGEVEGFLACNPDIAARVMAQMHRQGRAMGDAGLAPRRSRRRVAAGLLACLVSGAFGWQVAQGPAVAGGWRESDGDAAPGYVEDALESGEAARVRAVMISQVNTPVIDAGELRRTLKLTAPNLPPGWRLIDAQVYPSDTGPALNAVLETPAGRQMNLFVTRANTAVTAKPVLARRGGEAVAYWEEGECAFVLTGAGRGAGAGDTLLQEAQVLAQAT